MLNKIKKTVSKIKKKSAYKKEKKIIEKSKLFDKAYYLKNNPDVKNQ